MKVTGNTAPPRVISPSEAGRAKRAYRTDDSGGRIIVDQVDLSALSTEELSPRVRETLVGLMAEVDSLKQALDNSERRIRELEELADMDTLLPIRNRRAFVRELRRMIAFAERYETPSTVVFIDLNDMKTINDKYGHDGGDAALFHVAQILTDNLRATDVVGRLGGDEFAVLLAQADEVLGREKAAILADKVMSTPLELPGGDQINLRLAHGTYTFHGRVGVEEALEGADKAMYDNKAEMKGGSDNIR